MTERALLIADSGSTKTDWMLLGEGGSHSFQTEGINPVTLSSECILSILNHQVCPQVADFAAGKALHIYFYGAGCRPELCPSLAGLISQSLLRGTDGGQVSVHSDMLGAARALLGDGEGIACILGTGANACLYDGRQIVRQATSLGYILGDEGSGATLGRLFVGALYEGRLPQSLLHDFEAETHLTLSEIIDRVYRQPGGNRFLASLSPFISSHLEVEGLRQLVVGSLRSFLRHSVLPLQADLPVNVVGSIACHYRPLLSEAVAAEGLRLGTVLHRPIVALADYHRPQIT